MSSRLYMIQLFIFAGLLGAFNPALAQENTNQPVLNPNTPAKEKKVEKPQSPTRILGKFKLAKSHSATEKDVHAAIEKIVDDMLFIKRPFARSRLKKTSIVCKSLVFKLEGKNISVKCNQKKPNQCPVNGKKIKTSFDGDPLKLACKVSPTKFVQKYFSEDGNRTNTYTLSKDNKTLTLKTKLESDQLPRPLIYKVVYKIK